MAVESGVRENGANVSVELHLCPGCKGSRDENAREQGKVRDLGHDIYNTSQRPLVLCEFYALCTVYWALQERLVQITGPTVSFHLACHSR